MRNIENLNPGDSVDHFFLVHKATQGVTAQGKDYMTLHLQDKSGEIEAKFWTATKNDMATIKFFKGKAFQVSPPNFVELEITQTEPGIKGNTATGATKPATVETGATVNVPLFVNEGDVLIINTGDGSYISRG